MLNKRFFKAKKRLLKWTLSILLVVNGKENGKKDNFFLIRLQKQIIIIPIFLLKDKEMNQMMHGVLGLIYGVLGLI